MRTLHNLVPSVSLVPFPYMKAFPFFSRFYLVVLKSRLILCTFPFSALVVDIYVAENSG